MEKKKKFKQEFVIEGVGETTEQKLDSLIALEPLFAFFGFNGDNDFNRSNFEYKHRYWGEPHMCSEVEDTSVKYYNHACLYDDTAIRLKANQRKKLISLLIKHYGA